MKKQTKYVIRNNKWVEDPMPITKQIEEKTTNKTIECSLCPNKKVSKYLRVIDIRDIVDSIDDLDHCKVRGYCCYDCANGVKLYNSRELWLAFLTIDNKRYYPELIRPANPNVFYGNVVDTTVNRIDDINKHRKRVARVHELAKIHNMLPKRRQTKRSIGIRVTAKDDDEWWRKFNTICKVMNQ
jgi:hypothetical protein